MEWIVHAAGNGPDGGVHDVCRERARASRAWISHNAPDPATRQTGRETQDQRGKGIRPRRPGTKTGKPLVLSTKSSRCIKFTIGKRPDQLVK